MALEEIHPDTLDHLRPLLVRTLNTGETVQLPYTAWSLHAQTQNGRPDPPRCTVEIADNSDLNEIAVAE